MNFSAGIISLSMSIRYTGVVSIRYSWGVSIGYSMGMSIEYSPFLPIGQNIHHKVRQHKCILDLTRSCADILMSHLAAVFQSVTEQMAISGLA